MDKNNLRLDMLVSISIVPEVIIFVLFMALPLAVRLSGTADIGWIVWECAYGTAMFLMYIKNEFFAARFLKKHFTDEYEYRINMLYRNRSLSSASQYNAYIDKMFENPKKYDPDLIRFFNGYELKISVNSILFTVGVIIIFVVYGLVLK